MKNRTALIITFTFFVAYGLMNTIGSIFLVSWGSDSLFKKILIFMGTFPIDWMKLSVEKSFGYTVLNILFWSIIVYFISYTIIRLLGKNKITLQ
jgi:hypothetical protein